MVHGSSYSFSGNLVNWGWQLIFKQYDVWYGFLQPKLIIQEGRKHGKLCLNIGRVLLHQAEGQLGNEKM